MFKVNNKNSRGKEKCRGNKAIFCPDAFDLHYSRTRDKPLLEYNLGQKAGDNSSKIGFSMECFTGDSLQFFTKRR